MTLHRFFLDGQVLADETAQVFPLALGEADRRHAKALRLSAHEHIAVIDGAGVYYECEVIEASDPPIVSIAARKDIEPSSFSVTLFQAIAKGAKTDDIVRGATELGVDRIVGLMSARTVVRLDGARALARKERWETIVHNAAMQSGRASMPSIGAPASIDALKEELSALDALVICWEEAPQRQTFERALDELFPDGLRSGARIGVVIGPEGGFGADEVQALRSSCSNAALVSLGPWILRVETAAIAALSQLAYELRRRER